MDGGYLWKEDVGLRKHKLGGRASWRTAHERHTGRTLASTSFSSTSVNEGSIESVYTTCACGTLVIISEACGWTCS